MVSCLADINSPQTTISTTLHNYNFTEHTQNTLAQPPSHPLLINPHHWATKSCFQVFSQIHSMKRLWIRHNLSYQVLWLNFLQPFNSKEITTSDMVHCPFCEIYFRNHLRAKRLQIFPCKTLGNQLGNAIKEHTGNIKDQTRLWNCILWSIVVSGIGSETTETRIKYSENQVFSLSCSCARNINTCFCSSSRGLRWI